MRTIVIYSPLDAVAAEHFTGLLEKRGFGVSTLQISNPPNNPPALNDRPRDLAFLLWSQAAARIEDGRHVTELAIKAWSDGPIGLVLLDDTPLPLGMRDLAKSRLSDWETGFGEWEKWSGGPELNVLRGSKESPEKRSRFRLRWLLGTGGLLLIVGAGLFSYLLAGAGRNVASLPNLNGLDDLNDVGQPNGHVVNVALSVLGGLCLLVIAAACVALLVYVIRKIRKWRTPTLGIEVAAEAVGGEVFVSYSSKDVGRVDAIVAIIKSIGQSIWIDRSSSGSARYAAKITQALRGSRIVALMCSEAAFKSDHVIRELYLAADFKKPLIAILLDATEIPDEALYFLTGYPRIQANSVSDADLSSHIRQALQG